MLFSRPDEERHHHVREDDDVPQRKQRNRPRGAADRLSLKNMDPFT
jgi:hypothetical protein